LGLLPLAVHLKVAASFHSRVHRRDYPFILV